MAINGDTTRSTPENTIRLSTIPLYLRNDPTLYTKYAGIRHPIHPKMGPKKDSSLRIGALSTMAPQDTETAKTKIPLETSSLLIFSAGKRRDKIFKAIPVHASLKPKKTLKYAVTTAKILRIRLKILTASASAPRPEPRYYSYMLQQPVHGP